MTYQVLKSALMALLITVVAPVGMAGEPLDKAQLDTLRAANSRPSAATPIA